ncbi:MAG: zinc dependent phospholipase C family protein, partial [Candidatus Acidiferrum sp.]
YRRLLAELREGRLDLPNDNFDVGESTGPGQYALNDDAQAELLDKIAARKFAGISPELRDELLHFFSEPGAPYATKRDAKAWAKVQTELGQLKNAAASPAAAGALDVHPF